MLMVFIGGINAVLGQEPSHCITSFSTATDAGYFSGKYNQAYLDSFPDITFGIYFWGIETSTGEQSVTRARVDSIMKEINKAFKFSNICFVLKGFDFVKGNDNLYVNSSPSAILNTKTP